jgi:hypothetical protein
MSRSSQARPAATATALAVDDFFQLVEQFLRAPDAEGRDQEVPLLAEGALDTGCRRWRRSLRFGWRRSP